MGPMYRLAVIANGVIENVILGDEDFSLPEKELVRLAEVDSDGHDAKRLIEESTAYPGIGWAYDGLAFTHPNDLEKPITQLKQHLAQYRFSVEQSGIIWEGERIGTSRDEQRVFGEIRTRVGQFPDEEMSYKTTSGKFITTTLVHLLPLAEAVYAYVQKCFKAEAYVSNMIDDASVTTVTQVEEAFDSQMG
jgi:hypothetical protein